MQNIETARDDQRAAADDECVRYIAPNDIAKHNGPKNAGILEWRHDGRFGHAVGFNHEIMRDADE